MSGRVYFIQDSHGRLKIGYSQDPAGRLRALQTAHGAELSLLGSVPGTISAERDLQKRFADLKLTGEWFRASDDLLSHVRALLAAPEIPLLGKQVRARDPEKQSFSDRLLAFLRERHPERTVAAVAEWTGVSRDSIAQWFSRGSLPSGEVALHLMLVYGPPFVRDVFGIEKKWVLDAVALEESRVAHAELAGALAAVERLRGAKAHEDRAEELFTPDGKAQR
ncbi:GIY-YIG nuclease family protein [Enterovirga aerilata]|uniref:Bacteriophage T5 Orf172 DNA-binding domain-containing protein n=1 Tax=Enterovirga aerilata TaxID=2730920 RepID=A0A849IF06_9HYPH|nr:hypothetical protein [Enterovirga sp. DB1703]